MENHTGFEKWQQNLAFLFLVNASRRPLVYFRVKIVLKDERINAPLEHYLFG